MQSINRVSLSCAFVWRDGVHNGRRARGKPTPSPQGIERFEPRNLSPCAPVAIITNLNRLGSERRSSGTGCGVCRVRNRERRSLGDASANSRSRGDESGMYLPVTSVVANRLRTPDRREKDAYQSSVLGSPQP